MDRLIRDIWNVGVSFVGVIVYSLAVTVAFGVVCRVVGWIAKHSRLNDGARDES